MRDLYLHLKAAAGQRKVRRLFNPFLFFVLEIIFIGILAIRLFAFIPGYNTPLILIYGVHPDSLTSPFGSFMQTPFIQIHNGAEFLTLCYLVSLNLGLLGMWVSIMWMRRFFRLNRINIFWWIWPTACLSGHIVFLLLCYALGRSEFISN